MIPCSTVAQKLPLGSIEPVGPKGHWHSALSGALQGPHAHFLSAKVVPAIPSPALTTGLLSRLPSSPIAVGSVLASDPGLGCLQLTACCVGLFKYCLYQGISADPDFGMYPLTPNFVTLSEGSSHLYPQ